MAMEQPKPTKELENERNREQEKKKSQEKLLEAKVQELLNEADKHLKDYDTKSALLIMNQIQALLGIKTKEEKEYDENTQEKIKKWQLFYKEIFNIELDTKDLIIPQLSESQKEKFKWLIIMPKGLTIDTIWNKVKEKMKTNAEIIFIDVKKSVRTTEKNSYVIWTRDTIEADPELANLSAEQIKEKGINPIMLEERLVQELFYNWKNPDKHLDLDNLTLCVGSRHPLGRVPSVRWFGGYQKLFVFWFNASSAYGNLSCLEAVSA